MGHTILLTILHMMSKTGERGQWVTLPVDKGYHFKKFSKAEHMEKNLAVNREHFEGHLTDIALDGGFIEHQNRYTDMKLGVCPFSYCGCEVIALYNALNALDPSGTHLKSLPDLIRSMEEKGVMHAGQFGTAPQALAAFLKEDPVQQDRQPFQGNDPDLLQQKVQPSGYDPHHLHYRPS